MTQEEIIAKAQEVFPTPNKEHYDFTDAMIVGLIKAKQEGYIKALTEINSFPKLEGWLSKDPEDSCVHLSFNKPEFDGTYWNDIQGPGIMYAVDENMSPNVKTNKPVKVELIIRNV